MSNIHQRSDQLAVLNLKESPEGTFPSLSFHIPQNWQWLILPLFPAIIWSLLQV